MESAPQAAQHDNGTPRVSAQLRGETIAYAVQSGIANLGANFFEPYIGYRTQKYFSKGNELQAQAHGSYSQNLVGEFAGDIIGSFALIAAEALCPEQLHQCTRTARHMIDPLYDRLAHAVLTHERDDPDYERKIAQWKVFQERNMVRSGIMAAAGITGNIATQKWVMHNPSPVGAIFQGKLLSTALTTAMGLGTRFMFPEPLKKMDKWMASRIFTPMMGDAGEKQPDGFTGKITLRRSAECGAAVSR